VILGAAVAVGDDALEQLEDIQRLDLEPGLLADLAARGVFEQLAGFDNAPWKRPLAFERLAAALDQQDALGVIEDQRTDAEEGAIRVAAANTAPILLR
jgi:hypothetical protein